MKRYWLVAVACLTALAARAEDPADRFLQAYFLIQEADAADQQSDLAKANAKYQKATQILQAIRTTAPDWNPHIIEYRLKYCEQKRQSLQGRLPAAPPPAAPVTPSAPSAPAAPVAAPPAAPADPAQVARLTADLAAAREQVQKLEATRDELGAKLQAALKEVPATQTNLRVEQLLEQNKEMSAKLAGAQEKIAALTEQAGQLTQAQEQVRQLETDRTRLTEQLNEARANAKAAGPPDARLAELVQKNQELTDQLTAAQKELAVARTAAAATAESPELKQLRTELTGTTTKLETTERELATTKQELASSRQQLETVRATNATLQRNYDALRVKLEETAKNLVALEQTGQKDAEIILFLRKENALLKQITARRSRFTSRPSAATGPSLPELKGWHPRRRAAPETPPAPAAPPPPVAKLTESANAQLVAEIAAPPPLPAAAPIAPPPPAAPLAAPPLTVTEAQAAAPARPEVPAAFAAGDEKTKTLLQEARAAIDLKDFDGATAKYQAVLELDPNNLLALSNLGVIHYQRGQLDDAEQHLRRAVALAPNDSESRSLLGIVYLRKGKIEEAFTELTRAVALNPRNSEAHNYLGITLSEKNWTAAAEQEMRKAIELNPQYADAHFNLAVLYASQRTPRLELARYHYQKARDLGAKTDDNLDKILSQSPAPAGQ